MPKLFFPSQKPEYRDPQVIRSQMAEIANQVRNEKPEVQEIILFGSYAAGQPSYFSDLDLLVVLSKDDRPPIDRTPEFLFLFRDSPLPVDVFVFTREEIEKRTTAKDPFILRALREGIRIA